MIRIHNPTDTIPPALKMSRSNLGFNIINVVSSSFAQDKPRQDVEATPWGIPGSSVLLCRVESVDFRWEQCIGHLRMLNP